METVVLVLTDVQGSTRLWQDEPTAMDAAMRRHHEIVHSGVAEHGGWRPVDQGEGDAVFAAFRSPTEAIAAVVQVQRQLTAEPWPTSVPLKVRIGVHVGEVTERAGNLYGDPVNRCARLRGLGAGGQTLLSAPVYELVRDKLPVGVSITDLGEHRMKDLTRPEHVWQLDLDSLPAEFPPLASLDRALHNLPVQSSPLIGREAELDNVLAALASHRLVTLTGFGGMGKTRLSLQAAAELADGDGDGVWFVDLAGATEPAAVPGLIGLATGLGGSDADSVIAGLAGQQLLLVLDNLEQVLGCAPFIGDLLARVPGARILATSREPLRLRGEQELALAPLGLPPEGSVQDAASLSAYAAVQLFVDRAVAVKADFAVTNENAPAVAAICQRLDGHPLAIELAAARVRMMTPQALLPRLDKALTVLTGGGRDMPGRHQTLRAAIAWSYDLLEPEERLLLDRMSVFAGAVAFEHVEAVCGADLDVFSALASLVEKSLVRTSLSDDGEDRYGMLLSIKAYAAEQLEAAGAVQDLRDRHADHLTAQVRYGAPWDAAAWLATGQSAAVLFDELAAAWAQVQTDPADPRTRSFPIVYFQEAYTRSLDVSGVELLVELGGDATPELLAAHQHLVACLGEEFREVPRQLYTRLHEVAEELGTPDAQLVALVWADRTHLGPEQRRARVAAIDALLPLVPQESPYGRDELFRLRDGMAAALLQFVDPALTAAAVARIHASPMAESTSLSNLILNRLWGGQWQEVLDLAGPVVAAGVVRRETQQKHVTVSAAARALVELGRPEEALEVLRPWGDELTRRGWQAPLELNTCCRCYALLTLGRPQEARDLLTALPQPYAMPPTRVMALRVERLAGAGDHPATAAASVADLEDLKWQVRPVYLAALVEQALREPDLDSRRALLARIEEHPLPLVLGYGYQADLDRLRAELG